MEGFFAIISYCVNSIDQRRGVVALVVSFHFIFVLCLWFDFIFFEGIVVYYVLMG